MNVGSLLRRAGVLLATALALIATSARAQTRTSLDGGTSWIDAGPARALEAEADAAVDDGGAGAERTPPSIVPPVASEPLAVAASSEAPIAVEVRGRRAATSLVRSADAVTVLNLAVARRRSSDLGEVLSRIAGVNIRRYGGLGSEFRLSINGLYDSAVRVFVDAVPIDRVYAMDVANVPVNLIDNVEVYRGVVPLRFGADALGGAINLVRPKRYETMAQASYSIGSYGQHRATLAGRYRHEPTGFVAGVETFYDRAENDYFIDAALSDFSGQVVKRRVRRFHDGYQAYGVAAEAGVVERPWARKLMLRAFTSDYDKEVPHNIVMTVPYGEVRRGARVSGALLSYENTFAERFDLETVASYAYRDTLFVDKSRWVYDWRGRRINDRAFPGEIESRARDQSTWQHSTFARATLVYRVRPGQELTGSISPTFTTRTGDERIQPDPNARDPLTAERKLLKSVFGIAYTAGVGTLARAPSERSKRRMEHHRLENVLFAKAYVYRTDAEESLPGNVFVRRALDRNRFGAGDALRLTMIDDWLMLKTSYEYATRLPETDEVFGNGMLILANLELEPELSHNINIELLLDKRRTSLGDFWVDMNLFGRLSENMIVLLGSDRFYTYQNVYGARSLGIENTVKWTSPGKYLTVDGQFTYTDQRNASVRGTFGSYKGDRIPNRPWLTASWGGFLHFEGVFTRIDSIEPFYQGRFVGDFFRGWESVGKRESKAVIPDQVSHNVGVTYALSPDRGGRVYATFDVQNVSDARLYDSFGVMRPGRAYYFKLTGEFY
jgi:vitamin B12 transporter